MTMNSFTMMLLLAMACPGARYTGYTKCSQQRPFNGAYHGVKAAPVVIYGIDKTTPYGGGPLIVENPYVEPLRKAERTTSPEGAETVKNPYVKPLSEYAPPKSAGKSRRIVFSNGTAMIVSPAFTTGSPVREVYLSEGLKEMK
jgi:hypothetical protein